jgi:hypothetical protein
MPESVKDSILRGSPRAIVIERGRFLVAFHRGLSAPPCLEIRSPYGAMILNESRARDLKRILETWLEGSERR